MVTTIYNCDKCGSVIGTDRSELVTRVGPWRKDRPRIDLCSSCLASLASWFGPGPGREREPGAAGRTRRGAS